MSTASALKVGRTRDGFRLRVEGRGTMRESPALHEFATHALDGGIPALVVDLSAAEHLDSTFLGSLVDLHRRYGRGEPPRLRIAAPTEVRRRLLGPNRLQDFFISVEAPPEILGEESDLQAGRLPPDELGRHMMECHRRLAEIEGPNQAAFGAIADRLARELSGGATPG